MAFEREQVGPWRPQKVEARERALRRARQRELDAELDLLDLGGDPVPSGPAIGACDTHIGSEAFWAVDLGNGGPPRLMCPRCFAPYAERLGS